MAKYRKKPVEIEAITFDELVEYGKANGANIVGGMPWSFSYKGQHISHENDECYLIPTLEGTMKFTSNDMLITCADGGLFVTSVQAFEMLEYERTVELTFQERVITEKAELDEKISKLCEFLVSENTLI